ncbi:MAG: NAD(P) transhydrogenase subunit alpha [Alphaproteobacteria bacterium]
MSVDKSMITESATDIAHKAQELANYAAELAATTNDAGFDTGEPFLITGLTVFVLACFVGYHVVWRVTPALHSPLMAITNAISSVIIVGALMAAGLQDGGISGWLGFAAVIMASINIFGGFIITRRMLHMFRKKG